MFFEGKSRTVFLLQTLLFTAFLAIYLCDTIYAPLAMSTIFDTQDFRAAFTFFHHVLTLSGNS